MNISVNTSDLSDIESAKRNLAYWYTMADRPTDWYANANKQAQAIANEYA